MLRIRHGLRLGADVVRLAVLNRMWWIVPVMLALAVVATLVAVGQAAAPYTLYTLF